MNHEKSQSVLYKLILLIKYSLFRYYEYTNKCIPVFIIIIIILFIIILFILVLHYYNIIYLLGNFKTKFTRNKYKIGCI